MGLKKPKNLKLPRKPKQSASNEVKERYLKRVAEVKRTNTKRLADWKRAVKKRETLNRKISAI